MQVVDQLSKPTGVANFPGALESAFQILERSAMEPLATSNCTKVIMIVSDGLMHDEKTQRVLSEYNADGNVLIFSFMVGFNDDPELKTVACSNGGHFYHIQTVGKVFPSSSMYCYLSGFHHFVIHIQCKRGSRHTAHAAKTLRWRVDQLLK